MKEHELLAAPQSGANMKIELQKIAIKRFRYGTEEHSKVNTWGSLLWAYAIVFSKSLIDVIFFLIQ